MISIENHRTSIGNHVEHLSLSLSLSLSFSLPTLSRSLSPAIPPHPNFFISAVLYPRKPATMGSCTCALEKGVVLIRSYTTNWYAWNFDFPFFLNLALHSSLSLSLFLFFYTYVIFSLSLFFSCRTATPELFYRRCSLSSETHSHGLTLLYMRTWKRRCFSKSWYDKLARLEFWFFLDIRIAFMHLSLSLSRSLSITLTIFRSPPTSNFFIAAVLYHRKTTAMGYIL